MRTYTAGKWIVRNVEDFKGRPTGNHFVLCCFCGKEEIISYGRAPFNYCPNCGADMREHENKSEDGEGWITKINVQQKDSPVLGAHSVNGVSKETKQRMVSDGA